MNSAVVVPLIIGGILLAGLLVLFWPARASQTKENNPTVYRDDDRYWIANAIYNNSDDPTVFVPKRYTGGYTVNFGHPPGVTQHHPCGAVVP